MINEAFKKILLDDKEGLVTPVNNVSMVFADNSLMHAMMILNNTTYTSIPVLDYENRFKGLISAGQIFKFLGEKINAGFGVLEQYKVSDAVDKNYYLIDEDFDLEEVIRALINYNYLCIVDKDAKLKGIIKRSVVLKRVNYLVHDFEKKYTIKPRDQRFFSGEILNQQLEKRYSS